MKKMPTDRKILRKIYDKYSNCFVNFKRGDPEVKRETKIYVPIEIEALAEDLKVDSDMLFGRLYYSLDKKHGYEQKDGSKVHLFALAVGKDRHAINFPLLSAVLAELEESYIRFTIPLVISVVFSILALTISIISIIL